MIEISLNPLERLGISQEMVKRFCAQNGVGVHDLGKLIQTVSRHASSPFHTDRNQTPGADQIFKDVQQAASEVDSEEKLGAAVSSYIGRSAGQVEMLREQYAFRLGLLQEKDKELREAFKNTLVQTIFHARAPKVKRFIISRPKLPEVSEQLETKPSDIFFPNAPIADDNVYEYHIRDDGTIEVFDLTRHLELLHKSRIAIYSIKPDDLILESPLKFRIEKDGCAYHLLFTRQGINQAETKKLRGIKIIGYLALSKEKNSISPYIDEVFRAGTVSNLPQQQLMQYAKYLDEGLDIEQFMPLIYFLNGNEHQEFILLGLRPDKKGQPRIFLLGLSHEVHNRTHGKY